MHRVKAVIFDLDGTLFDLGPLVSAARQRVARLLHECGFFPSEADAIRRIEDLERNHGPYYSSSPYYFAFYDIAKSLGSDNPELCQKFLNQQHERRRATDTDEVESFVRALEAVYNREDVEMIAPYPDAVQALTELKSLGCKLILLTVGRTSRQQNKIDQLGVASYFDRIIMEGPPSHDYWISEILDEYGNEVELPESCPISFSITFEPREPNARQKVNQRVKKWKKDSAAQHQQDPQRSCQKSCQKSCPTAPRRCL